MKEAKAELVKGKANAKVDRVATVTNKEAATKQAEARTEATADKREAEYKVAIEKWLVFVVVRRAALKILPERPCPGNLGPAGNATVPGISGPPNHIEVLSRPGEADQQQNYENQQRCSESHRLLPPSTVTRDGTISVEFLRRRPTEGNLRLRWSPVRRCSPALWSGLSGAGAPSLALLAALRLVLVLLLLRFLVGLGLRRLVMALRLRCLLLRLGRPLRRLAPSFGFLHRRFALRCNLLGLRLGGLRLMGGRRLRRLPGLTLRCRVLRG